MFGVTAMVDDAGPRPTEFTGVTRNAYMVPLVKPETVADGAADSPSANTDHDDELLVEYSTM